jgi:hypothetical protein
VIAAPPHRRKQQSLCELQGQGHACSHQATGAMRATSTTNWRLIEPVLPRTSFGLLLFAFGPVMPMLAVTFKKPGDRPIATLWVQVGEMLHAGHQSCERGNIGYSPITSCSRRVFLEYFAEAAEPGCGTYSTRVSKVNNVWLARHPQTHRADDLRLPILSKDKLNDALSLLHTRRSDR